MDYTSMSSSSSLFDLDPTKQVWLEEHCPCWADQPQPQDLFGSSSSYGAHRFLEDEEPPTPVWHTVVVAVTLVIMLGFMMSDYIGPDWYVQVRSRSLCSVNTAKVDECSRFAGGSPSPRFVLLTFRRREGS
jgi:hypothetical protein